MAHTRSGKATGKRGKRRIRSTEAAIAKITRSSGMQIRKVCASPRRVVPGARRILGHIATSLPFVQSFLITRRAALVFYFLSTLSMITCCAV